MKRKELIDAFEYLDINVEMERRLIQNCQLKNHKKRFLIVPKKVAVIAIALSIMSFSATVFAFTTGIIKIALTGSDFSANTNYLLELQKNVILLNRDSKEKINQAYIDFNQHKTKAKTFDSFSEVEDFLGISILDNVLFQNNQEAVSLEVYGDKNQPNRVKLVSYQTIKGYNARFPVIAEFAIDASGNFSKIIASSSGVNKETRSKTYHSKINDITAQIIIINNKDTQAYDLEVYFVQDDILYNFTILGDRKSSIDTLVKVTENIIDSFIL